MRVYVKPQQYPIISYGDMVGRGIRFQVVSTAIIPFLGKGVWSISEVSEKSVPKYKYSIYRIQDTSCFEFEDDAPVDAERMYLLFIFDREDRQYKLLAISMRESPEFMSVINTCDIFETEFFVSKHCPDDSCRYYSTRIEPYEYEVYLGENENAFVEKNFKKKSLKQIRLMEKASSFELKQQHTRLLLN